MREKLKDTAFEDFRRGAHVCATKTHCSAMQMMIPVFQFLIHAMVFVSLIQETIVIRPWVALAIRPRPGVWELVRVNVSELAVEEFECSQVFAVQGTACGWKVATLF